MMVLWERNGQRSRRIGAKLDLDSGTLSPLLKRLEKLGMITARARNDERQVVNFAHRTGKATRRQALDKIAPQSAIFGCGVDDMDEMRDRVIKLKTALDGAVGHD